MERRVLIVDDEEANRKLLKIILKRLGYSFTISEATNGQEAVKKLKKNKFDIVFLDVLLPDINGTELIPYIDKHSKIVLITALENEEIKTIREVDYLQKPINIEKLKSLLISFIHNDEI